MKDNLKTKDTSMKTAKGTRPQAKRSVSRGNPRPIKRLIKKLVFKFPDGNCHLRGTHNTARPEEEGQNVPVKGLECPPSNSNHGERKNKAGKKLVRKGKKRGKISHRSIKTVIKKAVSICNKKQVVKKGVKNVKTS